MHRHPESLDVVDDPAAHRYTIDLGGDRLAFLTYRRSDTTIVLLHVEVPEALRGRGIGSHLTGFVLDEARRNGLAVDPVCPFVIAFIRRHPEYESLVRA